MDILIVDDEHREVAIIEHLLKGAPFNIKRIYKAYSLKETIEILKKYPVPVVLCDIEMPGGNGLELAEWIEDNKLETEIIYLTGHTDFSYVRTALRFGVVDYLVKPIERESLWTALKKAFSRIPIVEEAGEERNAAEIVKDIKKYIYEQCSEDISRKEIAEKFFIHPDYLSHIFKEKEGVSFSLYLIKCRIEKAKKLLGSTDMSIMKVSMMSGYSNPAYFTKHFKRITGITPKEYRAQLEDLKG